MLSIREAMLTTGPRTEGGEENEYLGEIVRGKKKQRKKKIERNKIEKVKYVTT